jgi:hypothetical protein
LIGDSSPRHVAGRLPPGRRAPSDFVDLRRPSHGRRGAAAARTVYRVQGRRGQ